VLTHALTHARARTQTYAHARANAHTHNLTSTCRRAILISSGVIRCHRKRVCGDTQHTRAHICTLLPWFVYKSCERRSVVSKYSLSPRSRQNGWCDLQKLETAVAKVGNWRGKIGPNRTESERPRPTRADGGEPRGRGTTWSGWSWYHARGRSGSVK
jgi:hypothetical protein